MVAEPGAPTLEGVVQAVTEMQAQLASAQQNASGSALRMLQMEFDMQALRKMMETRDTDAMAEIKTMVEAAVAEKCTQKDDEKKKKVK